MDMFQAVMNTAPNQYGTDQTGNTTGTANTTADPYAGYQWGEIPQSSYVGAWDSPMLNLGNIPQTLGFTGNMWDVSKTGGGGGVSGNDYTDQYSASQAFQDWLKQNNYSLVQSYGPSGQQQSGTAYNGIRDASGKILGANSFNYSDSNGWLGQVVPAVLAGIGGIAGAGALGFGPASAGAGVGATNAATDAALIDMANSGSITPSFMGGGTAAGAGGGLAGSLYPGLGAGTSAGATLPSGVADAIVADAGNVGMDAALIDTANSGGGITAGSLGSGGTAAGAAPGVFNAAQDSQLANAAMPNGGLGGPPPSVPSGVNLGSLGGVMGTGTAGTLGSILGNAGSRLLSNAAGSLTSPQGLGALLGIANANNQRNFWKDQMDEINKNFSVDSPYAQKMEKKLAAEDAAGGRRSQYGTRAVELAGNLAEKKANSIKDLMMMGNNAFTAQNNGLRDLASLFGSSNSSGIFSGLSSDFQDLLKLIGGS
jgi:hypothetical protein